MVNKSHKPPKGLSEYKKYPKVKTQEEIDQLPSIETVMREALWPHIRRGEKFVIEQEPGIQIVFPVKPISFPTNKTGVKKLEVQFSSSLSTEQQALHGLHTKMRVSDQEKTA